MFIVMEQKYTHSTSGKTIGHRTCLTLELSCEEVESAELLGATGLPISCKPDGHFACFLGAVFENMAVYTTQDNNILTYIGKDLQVCSGRGLVLYVRMF